jgi:NDP-sugar pyrophosphorylase family protein
VKGGIIAAGDGARMSAAGLVTPKPLLRVGGISLIERTMRALVAAGVDEISFVVNERMTSVIDAVSDLRLGVPIHAVVATTPSSMHSLQALAPHLATERFVLCTVDSVLHPVDFSAFIRRFASRAPGEIQLAYTAFVDDESPLRIAVRTDDRITELGEAAAESPYVTLGLYGMGPEIFPVLDRAIAEGVTRLRNFLGRLLTEGMEAHGYRIAKGIDVDRPHDLVVAESFVETFAEREGART